jgi:predicted lipoprotein with Yx(FWY)xxD motif
VSLIPRNAPAHPIKRIGMLTGAFALTLAVGAQASTVVQANATKHVVLLVSTRKSATLGTFLDTTSGRTLYTFALDTGTKSACTGECAAAWPPLLVPKGAKLSNLVHGVKASKLGEIRRPNGKFQLTYDGKPLYRFAGDKVAGQTTGQGFANDWFVALVTPAATTTAPTAAPLVAPTPQATSSGSSGSSGSHSSSGSSGSSTPTPTQPPTPTPTQPPTPTPTQPPTPTPTQPPTPTPTQPPGGGGGGGYGY